MRPVGEDRIFGCKVGSELGTYIVVGESVYRSLKEKKSRNHPLDEETHSSAPLEITSDDAAKELLGEKRLIALRASQIPKKGFYSHAIYAVKKHTDIPSLK